MFCGVKLLFHVSLDSLGDSFEPSKCAVAVAFVAFLQVASRYNAAEQEVEDLQVGLNPTNRLKKIIDIWIHYKCFMGHQPKDEIIGGMAADPSFLPEVGGTSQCHGFFSLN